MAKSIVVLLDGTWNQPEPLEGNKVSGDFPTNVYRTWRGLGGPKLDADATQRASSLADSQEVNGVHLIYVRGVGTDGGKMERKIDGATGEGVVLRIKQAYELLSKAYHQGDAIYVLGFSRGALAAWSLTNMLDVCGLSATPLGTGEVDRLFSEYQHGRRSKNAPVPVAYLGLWDTVVALAQADSKIEFHLARATNVKAVRHAIALDEQRRQFRVELWSEERAVKGVTEAWFCGAHSNIGGGYKNSGLSNIALFWLLAGAKRAGLSIDLGKVVGFDGEKFAPPIDSWKEFWNEVYVIGEAVVALGDQKEQRRVPDHHVFHESVLEALEKAGSSYQPLARTSKGLAITKETLRARIAPWEIGDDGELDPPV